MTLARDGIKEMTACTVVLGGLAVLTTWAAVRLSPWFWPLAVVLVAAWAFSLLFFRIPARTIPGGTDSLISPADGRVTEITLIDQCPEIGRPALRVGIFLSVFDVHVNRAPCSGTVVSVKHCPGEFLDARHPECGIRNESNTVVLSPGEIRGPIVIRQVAGLIARRIICHLRAQDSVERGQLFGMIKFGSRTELIVPQDAGLEAAVSVGDHVKGGSTILLRHARLSGNVGTAPVQRQPVIANA